MYQERIASLRLAELRGKGILGTIPTKLDGIRGDQCNLSLSVRPKRSLESEGEEEEDREKEVDKTAHVGSDDPSDVEIILDQVPMPLHCIEYSPAQPSPAQPAS